MIKLLRTLEYFWLGFSVILAALAIYKSFVLTPSEFWPYYALFVATAFIYWRRRKARTQYQKNHSAKE
jgi:hypothetical protein